MQMQMQLSMQMQHRCTYVDMPPKQPGQLWASSVREARINLEGQRRKPYVQASICLPNVPTIPPSRTSRRGTAMVAWGVGAGEKHAGGVRGEGDGEIQAQARGSGG